MKTVIQKVKHASVTIDGKIHGQIQQGYMILVGFQHEDTLDVVAKMADKISKLRIFEDEQGKMNLSIHQVQGAILSISQFTLYADSRKGNRPSFEQAARPDQASVLYDAFNEALRQHALYVETGIFQSDMKVELLNDGPVTVVLDSKELWG